MSVRFSQLLVAIVLALVAFALYRTVNAYQESLIASTVRTQGASIVKRETQRLGERVAAIEGLAATTAMNGYEASQFVHDANATMGHDSAVLAIDFFNKNDDHIAHVQGGSEPKIGTPPKRRHSASIPTAELQAVELALFDAELSRATSMADIAPTSPNLTAPKASQNNTNISRGEFFLATRVIYHDRDLGTVVEYLDPQVVIVDDVARMSSVPFEIDDGRGRPLAIVQNAGLHALPDTQGFQIPFADRELQLTLGAARHLEVNPLWFALGWLALVFAIVMPIEVVGHINRRVQALNEELEDRVAERTKELEKSLEESRRLALVVESVREGVLAIGASGCVRYVNAALCKELECKATDVLNRPVDEVEQLGISKQQLSDIRNDVSQTGFVYREMERTRTNGTKYVAGVTFTRHGHEGSSTLIAVSRDVTQRRRLIDELFAAKGKLEHEMHARADFIATASHELRTPITTLRTLSALLVDKLSAREPLPPDEARLLDILDHETRRLSYLVEDLLKIAKLDAPESAIEAVELDLGALVQNEIEEVSRFARPGPPVAVHVSQSPVVVRGDPKALRSIIDNLVGNARKFTDASGRVDVSVEQAGTRVRLIVADTGAGISESDLPHIFERFYRGPKTAAHATGAGLGLTIVARFVELMHGTISVASEVGRGTTVTIEFPAVIAPCPAHVMALPQADKQEQATGTA